MPRWTADRPAARRGRNIRIEDDLWLAALEATAEEGTTISDVLRADLERYVKRAQRRKASRPAE